jgi:hypothetical protein
MKWGVAHSERLAVFAYVMWTREEVEHERNVVMPTFSFDVGDFKKKSNDGGEEKKRIENAKFTMFLRVV